MKKNFYKFFMLFGISIFVFISCSNYKEKEKIASEYNKLLETNEFLRGQQSSLQSTIIHVRVQEVDKSNSTMTFDISNYSPIGIKGMQGKIIVRNQFGDNICDFNAEIIDLIPPKGTVNVSFTYNCNANNYKSYDLRCEWETGIINFEDGNCTGMSSGTICMFWGGMSCGIGLGEDDISRLSIEDINGMLEYERKNNDEIKTLLKKYFDYQ
jgi:hypothetical protein